MCACEALGGLHMTAAAHPGLMTSSAGMLGLHLACCLVLCFALPVLASVLWESMARKQYAQYKAEAEAQALQAVDASKKSNRAAQAWPYAGGLGDDKQQQASPSSSSSRIRSANTRTLSHWEEGSDCTPSTVFRRSTSSNWSSCDTLLLHSSGPVAGSGGPQHQLQASSQAAPETPPAAAAAAPVAVVDVAELRAQLVPTLTYLLGRAAADRILSVPAVQHDSLEAQPPDTYIARSVLTPVSIKVRMGVGGVWRHSSVTCICMCV
jgi:hypothetical protein